VEGNLGLVASFAQTGSHFRNFGKAPCLQMWEADDTKYIQNLDLSGIPLNASLAAFILLS
jgi:hypothetical protein